MKKMYYAGKEITDFTEEALIALGLSDEIEDGENLSQVDKIIADYEQYVEDAETATTLASVDKARTYLDATDFYMTIDKYAQLDEDKQAELTELRESARETIRAYEA